jgi:hypothetical protein
MNQEHYAHTLRIIWSICATVDALPLDDMIAAQLRAETIGPVVDPTLYRNQLHAFTEDCEATRLVRELRDGVRKLKADGDDRRQQRRSDDHDRQADPTVRD